ncbi:MAG: hypothetical protein IJV62_02035 [Eggerthellaceae bacterium]|nr:hypothetical protein [Eggerthellaceae bacterium]
MFADSPIVEEFPLFSLAVFIAYLKLPILGFIFGIIPISSVKTAEETLPIAWVGLILSALVLLTQVALIAFGSVLFAQELISQTYNNITL